MLRPREIILILLQRSFEKVRSVRKPVIELRQAVFQMELAATKPASKFEQVVRRQRAMPMDHFEEREIALCKCDRSVFGASSEAMTPATAIGSHGPLVAQRTALVTVRYEARPSAMGAYVAACVIVIFSPLAGRLGSWVFRIRQM